MLREREREKKLVEQSKKMEWGFLFSEGGGVTTK